ncbi:hypothetical protein [Empedobacter sedimenti]|uniref:hypothetical protein n=1 Tax=Empedobacter sedimenti TaxID=3042610 RepID=UPI0024A69BB5|nr:hypothetical protein [Empedobacter sedimenti]
MKNLFLLATLLVSSFSLANTSEKEESITQNYTIEYKFIDNTCYARFCWNKTETTRECGEWQEVPCNTTIEVEAKVEEQPK